MSKAEIKYFPAHATCAILLVPSDATNHHITARWRAQICEVSRTVICSRPQFITPTIWTWFALQSRWLWWHVPDTSLMRMGRRMTLTTSCTCRMTPLCTPPSAGCHRLPSAARAGTGDCMQIRRLTVRWKFLWSSEQKIGTYWKIFVWCLAWDWRLVTCKADKVLWQIRKVSGFTATEALLYGSTDTQYLVLGQEFLQLHGVRVRKLL